MVAKNILEVILTPTMHQMPVVAARFTDSTSRSPGRGLASLSFAEATTMLHAPATLYKASPEMARLNTTEVQATAPTGAITRVY